MTGISSQHNSCGHPTPLTNPPGANEHLSTDPNYQLQNGVLCSLDFLAAIAQLQSRCDDLEAAETARQTRIPETNLAPMLPPISTQPLLYQQLPPGVPVMKLIDGNMIVLHPNHSALTGMPTPPPMFPLQPITSQAPLPTTLLPPPPHLTCQPPQFLPHLSPPSQITQVVSEGASPATTPTTPVETVEPDVEVAEPVQQPPLSRADRPRLPLKGGIESGKLRRRRLHQNYMYRALLREKGIFPINRGPENYVCSNCGESFQKEMFMWRHGVKHLNHKPFKCDICDAPFNRSDSLGRHVRHFHGEI